MFQYDSVNNRKFRKEPWRVEASAGTGEISCRRESTLPVARRLAPKGRDEDGLAFTMSWVRHHDKYDGGYQHSIREEGQLYEGGPIWRIEQISPEFPR